MRLYIENREIVASPMYDDGRMYVSHRTDSRAYYTKHTYPLKSMKDINEKP